MNHYVYEITNLINGKKYIGKRSCKCPIEEDKYMGSGTYLKKAIEKYGIENFKKDILQICENETVAYNVEKQYIQDTNALKSSKYYNATEGGKGFTSEVARLNIKAKWSNQEYRDKMSAIFNSCEHKMKVSNFHKGRKRSEETKRKIGDAHRGKITSDSARLKMRNARINRYKGIENHKSRQVVMISLSGECLNEFDSISSAGEYINKSYQQIQKACYNKKGIRYGYLWLYKEDYLNYINSGYFNQWLYSHIEIHEKKVNSNKEYSDEPIYQLDKNTFDILNEYDNINQLSEKTLFKKSRVRDVCNHKYNTCHGYAWIFKYEYERFALLYGSDIQSKLKDVYSHKYKPVKKDAFKSMTKSVVCLNTLEVFNSIGDASVKSGVKRSGISNVCLGKRNYAGKINGEPAKWMYYEDYLKTIK